LAGARLQAQVREVAGAGGCGLALHGMPLLKADPLPHEEAGEDGSTILGGLRPRRKRILLLKSRNLVIRKSEFRESENPGIQESENLKI
jgi:hypothetical protein